MRLAGLRNTSLIDYPEKIAAVVFTRGCNFHCSYCHNSQLIPVKPLTGDEDFPEELFFNFLDQRKALLDGVVITGGEPTVQADLLAFIKKIRAKGLKIKLDTNGSNFKIIEKLISNKLLDYVAMDIKLPWDKYDQLAPDGVISEIKESVKLLIEKEIEYEFRTTLVPGIHQKEDIQQIARQIEGADKFYLQNFRPVNNLDKSLTDVVPFSPTELEKFKNIAGKFVDVVEIRD